MLIQIIVACVIGCLAWTFLFLALKEWWIFAKPAPVPKAEPSILDRMIEATAKRCTNEEAHIVISACRTRDALWEDVCVMLQNVDSHKAGDAELYRLFMLCCRRTLTRARVTAYRGQELN